MHYNIQRLTNYEKWYVGMSQEAPISANSILDIVKNKTWGIIVTFHLTETWTIDSWTDMNDSNKKERVKKIHHS